MVMGSCRLSEGCEVTLRKPGRINVYSASGPSRRFAFFCLLFDDEENDGVDIPSFRPQKTGTSAVKKRETLPKTYSKNSPIKSPCLLPGYLMAFWLKSKKEALY